MSVVVLDEIAAHLNAKDLRLAATSRVLLEAFLALAREADASRIVGTPFRTELGAREGKVPSAATLRQRLKRLNDALSAAKAPFQLKSSGGDVVAEPTGKFDINRQMERVHDALREISNEATRVDAGGMIEPKAAPESQILWVFFSYASLNRSEQRIQNGFFDLVTEKLAYPPPEFERLPKIRLWRDEHDIAPTRPGDAQMDEGCKKAFLGLLMLSNKYPHSSYCRREVDYFLTEDGQDQKGKVCLVINVNLRRGEIPKRFTSGTRIVQPESKGKHLVQLWSKGDAHDRTDFADRIAKQIFTAARGLMASGPSEGTSIPPPTEDIARFMQERKYPTDPHDIVDPRARPGLISPKIGAGTSGRDSHDEGVPIVQHLLDWATGDVRRGPRLVALLGEFGMGKTVACQIFTQRLLDLGKTDRAMPVPIYLDLRDVEASEKTTVPDLETLINQMLRKAGERPPNARDVIKFARERHAVVIFDGLDEVTNKLPPDAAVRLYRELLAIVPSECWAADNERRRLARARKKVPEEAMLGPRVVISCRTHYFRDVAAQRAFLTGMERARLEADQDIAAFFMLPFTDEQIEAYLKIHFGDAEATRALDLIKETYNLRELAARPILLRFIRETIGRIESEKLAGRVVNLARLYDILVEQVFERDNPKHIIPTREKRQILQALALHLHDRGQNEISYDKLDAWFQQYVETVPRLAAAMRGAGGLTLSEIFAQDLRNASLLVRPGEAAFRFAHTSVHEYFLASALHAAAQDGRGDTAWDVALPTPETLEFLLQRQIIEEPPEQRSFAREVGRLLEPGHKFQTRVLAFSVWKRARDAGSPLPRPREIDLSGMDLSRQKFAGTQGRLFPLENSLWRGARLNQTEFSRVDLSDANFSGAEAPMSVWLSCQLGGSTFDGANLTGAMWRECDIPAGVIDGAELQAARAIKCLRSGRNWRPQPQPGDHAIEWRAWSLSLGPTAAVAIVSLPGKDVIVSGGSDGVIRVFDLAAGIQVAVLEGHVRWVSSIRKAFCGGKNLIISFGEEGTARVFDLVTGKQVSVLVSDLGPLSKIELASYCAKEVVVAGCQDGRISLFDLATRAPLITLKVKKDWVHAIAFGPYGGKEAVFAGGWDKKIRVFDPTTGAQLAVFEGHEGWVTSIALVSSAGKDVIVSGGQDGKIRIFDLAAGLQVAVIEGHHGWINTIAVTSSGGKKVVVSGGQDGTIRVFDLLAGVQLSVIESHQGWVNSIDVGSVSEKDVIVSGGQDGTIRVFDLSSGAELVVLEGHQQSVDRVAVSSCRGKDILVASGGDEKVRVFDLDSGAQSAILQVYQQSAESIAVTPYRGRHVLVAGGYDGAIRIFDFASGAQLAALESHAGPVDRLFVATRNGESVIVACCGSKGGVVRDDHKGSIRIFNLTTLTQSAVLEIDAGLLECIAVAPCDGKDVIITSSRDKKTRIVDLAAGAQLSVLKGDNVCVSIAVQSYRGKDSIVLGGADGTIRVFEPASGAQLAAFEIHQGSVSCIVAASYGGKDVIVSGGRDGMVRIVDLASGTQLAVCKSHQGWINSIAVAIVSGKNVIISGGLDGKICVLYLTPGGLSVTQKFFIVPSTGSTIKLKPNGNGGELLLHASPRAWRDWGSRFQVGNLVCVTDIEDMPRVTSVE